MANNPASRPGDEANEEHTRGAPEAGSDADQVRNEQPGQPTTPPEDVPDQTKASSSDRRQVRAPGQGPGQNTEFGRNPEMPDDRQSNLPEAPPAWWLNIVFMMGGAFFLIIAIIVVLYFALR